MNKQTVNEQCCTGSTYAGHENINILAEAGWTYARVMLFTDGSFNNANQQQIRRWIFNFLAGTPIPYDGYLEFCKRITLAAEYLFKHNKGRMPMSPLTWFDPTYTEGFLRTGLLLQQFRENGRRHNRHTHQWKSLAESILDITGEDSDVNYTYWANWFFARRAWLCYRLFIEALVYHHFKTVIYE